MLREKSIMLYHQNCKFNIKIAISCTKFQLRLSIHIKYDDYLWDSKCYSLFLPTGYYIKDKCFLFKESPVHLIHYLWSEIHYLCILFNAIVFVNCLYSCNHPCLSAFTSSNFFLDSAVQQEPNIMMLKYRETFTIKLRIGSK